MPKRRNLLSRKEAETLRIPSVGSDSEEASRWVASLVVVQGAEIDLGRHILCDRPVTIGRDTRVELSLNDGSISRSHCSVEREPETGRYVLIDLGSTNGTRINGRQVKEHVPLDEGDKVFLGSSVVRFSYADALDLQYQARLEEMVTTDALTGLFSKRQYDAVYRVMGERATASETPFSLMVLDIDGLKPINDTYGHEMGGFVIAEVATVLRGGLDEHGMLCRFGGDEFVGCFLGVAKTRAVELAEDVRRRIEEHEFDRDGARIRPTISIGVASYPEDLDDPHRLFATADLALYRAKRAGKNQVVAADTAAGDADDPDPTIA